MANFSEIPETLMDDELKQKILIVDDKQENLYALEKILSETDALIFQAVSGDRKSVV